MQGEENIPLDTLMVGDVERTDHECSVCRKIDMLETDLLLKKSATRSIKRSKKRTIRIDTADAAYHFVAFVPAEGSVWRLDGLQRQPYCMGKCRRTI